MTNPRTIHIKGTGTASATPDYIVITLELTAHHMEYAKAMRVGAQQVEMLREAVKEAGFSAEDLKSTNFDVDTEYEDAFFLMFAHGYEFDFGTRESSWDKFRLICETVAGHDQHLAT